MMGVQQVGDWGVSLQVGGLGAVPELYLCPATKQTLTWSSAWMVGKDAGTEPAQRL